MSDEVRLIIGLVVAVATASRMLKIARPRAAASCDSWMVVVVLVGG